MDRTNNKQQSAGIQRPNQGSERATNNPSSYGFGDGMSNELMEQDTSAAGEDNNSRRTGSSMIPITDLLDE
jgi:hypothetical protein